MFPLKVRGIFSKPQSLIKLGRHVPYVPIPNAQFYLSIFKFKGFKPATLLVLVQRV